MESRMLNLSSFFHKLIMDLTEYSNATPGF